MRQPSPTLLLALAAGLAGTALAGPLQPPPGAVGPTMKTLDQVEPRTPISASTTPGDATFPPSVFKITQPGSYYVTGNFQVPADKVGIMITCDNVSIDLGGFTISSGLAAVYASSSGGVGVLLSDIRVRNGTVKAQTSYGIGLPTTNCARIDAVTAVDCDSGITVGEFSTLTDCLTQSCGTGLQASRGSSARNCTASDSDELGFYLGDGSSASSCLAIANGTYGFILGNGSSATACVAQQSGSVGIGVLQDCVVADCSVQNSGTDGITTGQGCVIRDTTAGVSGRHGFSVIAGTTVQNCTARQNGEDGINASWQCRLVGNTCQGNGTAIPAGAGIRVTSWGSRVEDNTLFGNDKGLVVSGTDNFIARNTSKNTGANYDVVAGNEFAPVLTNPGTTFTGATPWSNFIY
jgi:hypothetical protein